MATSSSKNSLVSKASATGHIQIKGAKQNNLKGFDLNLPLGKLNVITGPSGSGKSSLAFDTIYAEGQRRYVETFSPYTRQFFERMDKPKVDSILGIPPAIAIEQVNQVRTTRSTVGTITEINDYLKLLFPRLASGKCPCCGKEVKPETPETILRQLFKDKDSNGKNSMILFGIPVPAQSSVEDFFSFLQAQGYLRILVFGQVYRTDEVSSYLQERKKLPAVVHVIQDRVKLEPANQARLHEAIETALRFGKGTLAVSVEPFDHISSYSTDWRCADCDHKLEEPTPGLFSFNSPIGACPHCRGFGKTLGLDLGKAIPNESLSIKQGVIKAFQGEVHQESQRDLEKCAKARGLDLNLPLNQFSKLDRAWLIDGVGGDPEEAYNRGEWYGVMGFFRWLESRSYKMHVRVFLSRYRTYTDCVHCGGGRLKPESFHFHIDGKTLKDLWLLPVDQLHHFFQQRLPEVSEKDRATQLLLEEVQSRLSYLERAGLGYLNLDRQTRTLSGGELQRVNLTTCLGASLVNTLFVLDEPSIGLHPRDIGRLIGVMEGLRDKGNTLLVVEHEEVVMRAADHLVEIGPGRGDQGGDLVFEGPLHKISKNTQSLTGKYLTGIKEIPLPSKRRKPQKGKCIEIRGAAQHNLKNVDIRLPLGIFCALTGVSGSGKSTLIHEVLYRHLMQQRGERLDEGVGKAKSVTGGEQVESVVLVDQSPLSRTPRSTPAVYLGVYDAFRQLFAETEDAKSEGITPGFFSFNTGDGRCARCTGNGFEKIEMQFLSDLYITCPECEGKRFQPAALKIRWEGLNIHELLHLTFDEAVAICEKHPSKKAQSAMRGMKLLCETGLGYLKLGQPLNTLSGGEAQRLKLIGHLLDQKRDAGKSLFLLDEPTTGLHFDDIALLLKLLHRLVDEGHSLLVIEHNLDVIRSADWIIDLGPEAGVNGGELVISGTPEEVAKCDKSWTGRYLKDALKPRSLASTPIAEARAVYDVEKTTPQKTGNAISIHGAREHNLKNISLEIPRDEFVVVTGLSGSGKSSLAFDLVFAEGQRRFLDSMSVYARTFAEQMEKPEVDLITGVPPTVAIEQRVSRGSGKSTVSTITEIYHFLRLLYSKLGTQFCPCCHQAVVKQSAASIVQQIQKLAEKQTISILAPLVKAKKGYHTDVAEYARKQGIDQLLVDGEWKSSDNFERLERFKEHHIDALLFEAKKGTSSLKLKEPVERALKLGKGTLKVLIGKQTHTFNTEMSCPQCGRSFEELDPRIFSFNSPHGWCPTCRGFGVHKKKGNSKKLRDDVSLLEAELEEEREFRGVDEEWVRCTTCHGSRMNEVARAVEVQGIKLEEIAELSAERAAERILTFQFSKLEAEIARDILTEIKQRLKFMQEVGLGYLQLNRGADTLSGGEAQRIRLASQLGSNLQGVLYVLDEPTIGLHPRDNVKLLDTLQALKNKGNSLLVVEHDEDTMHRADTIIDLGPGAGRFGGEVIATGNLTQILKQPQSVTGVALKNPMSHPLRGERRKLPKKTDKEAWLEVLGAHANNLKNIDVALPLERLTVLTGISGSGKSSFMRSVLHPAVKQALSKPAKKVSKEDQLWTSIVGANHFASVFEVDQSPIGKTSRSCPATYVGILDDIRKLFAQLPTSRARGFEPSRFSFNVEGGRCEACQGNGEIKVEMNFLPTTRVHCETCHGMRFNAATQEVLYNGKNIGEVLKMSIQEAAEFFAHIPRLARPLQLLTDTGLGYLQLGQPSPTLSGGEAQRMKLVTELNVGQGRTITEKMKGLKNLKKNLYLIEEPTIGLHANDVRRLIDVLHRLVDEGHTVVVIEHELHVIAEADYIIDIGPEAGERGGKVVASGTPEQLAKSKTSQTAPFLAKLLK